MKHWYRYSFQNGYTQTVIYQARLAEDGTSNTAVKDARDQAKAPASSPLVSFSYLGHMSESSFKDCYGITVS
ncbi:hypothetical protein [Neptuniibacter sp. QD48_11]|uniref:hypothetical protein n=1 Tax=unclassified Neptuniibacter TaxID=2630693 RepID=UPI0039F4B87C